VSFNPFSSLSSFQGTNCACRAVDGHPWGGATDFHSRQIAKKVKTLRFSRRAWPSLFVPLRVEQLNDTQDCDAVKRHQLASTERTMKKAAKHKRPAAATTSQNLAMCQIRQGKGTRVMLTLPITDTSTRTCFDRDPLTIMMDPAVPLGVHVPSLTRQFGSPWLSKTTST